MTTKREPNIWADVYGSMGSNTVSRMIELPLDVLDPWEGANGEPQPFHPYSQQMLEDLAENIRDCGVIEPICVRPKPDGRFQILAGHNRVGASKLAGKRTIPAYVRQLDDNLAHDLMIYSNLKHRPKLLPSEKARAYHALMESASRQGKRTDLTSDQLGPKLAGYRADKKIAGEVGESATNVKRFIRLVNLEPVLLNMVDQEQIGVTAGVDLSYLSGRDQAMLVQIVQAKNIRKISGKQAVTLRQAEDLDQGKILCILGRGEKKLRQKESIVKLPSGRISRFFPPNTSPEIMEARIYEALLRYYAAKQGRTQ